MLDADGFELMPSVLSPSQCDSLCTSLSRALPACDNRPRGGRRGVIEQSPEVAGLFAAPAIRELIAAHLGPSALIVRSILFDKTPESNWKVTWHQDQTIAVAERHDGVPGYGPFSVKAGVTHCQAPAALLGRMLTLRLHLDDCGPDNGPLRSMPGSHKLGLLDAGEAIDHVSDERVVTCFANRGDILMMRPLTLHASSKATAPSRRRVLHVECAPEALPAPLAWHSAIPIEEI